MKILEILTPKRKTGNFGENAAAKYLKKHGYKIVAKNYVANGHEIDIIARTKEVTAFVEVKTRTVGRQNPIEARPASSVTKEKQRSIIKASEWFIATSKVKTKYRFDVIEVYVNEKNGRKSVAELKHLVNTFNLDTAFPHKKLF